MNEFITSGAIHSIKNIFQKNTERNVIIDPFSCLIKLSLLRFLDSGTKISIHQNRIHFNSPTYIQGFIRFIYGDNREHLHNLYLPIKKCVEWFWNEKNNDMTFMFNNAVIGLKMLKNSYGNYDTIQHTINYFIIILMQKNANLVSKLGIRSLDIDIITNEILEEDNKTQNNIELKKEDSNGNNNCNGKKKQKDTNKNQNADEPQNVNNISKDKSNDDIHTENLKDIHKFLFDLWNQREINIVINLYKEMESKQNCLERDNIYNNIMNYCSMKEDKLYSYIQENSSIL